MSNMSYCRFQNTSIDLQDCLEAANSIQEKGAKIKDILSDEEYKSFKYMLEQAEQLIELAGYED